MTALGLGRLIVYLFYLLLVTVEYVLKVIFRDMLVVICLHYLVLWCPPYELLTELYQYPDPPVLILLLVTEFLLQQLLLLLWDFILFTFLKMMYSCWSATVWVAFGNTHVYHGTGMSIILVSFFDACIYSYRKETLGIELCDINIPTVSITLFTFFVIYNLWHLY